MIELSNGHSFTYVAASGALGFDGLDAGQGIIKLYKKPFRWLGLLDPKQFTIIGKTLTLLPREGNLTQLRPWRAVRKLPKSPYPTHSPGWVNAVALTNPGLEYWKKYYYPRIRKNKLNYIISLSPNSIDEAKEMIRLLRGIIVQAIELNLSCPNSQQNPEILQETINTYKTTTVLFEEETYKPIIIKLGIQDPYTDIIKATKQHVQAYDLINSIPWFLDATSPLRKYGYDGSISGPVIRNYARQAAKLAWKQNRDIQIISGGGIDSVGEVVYRLEFCGAKAVSFGTAFLKPWTPNCIIRKHKRNVCRRRS